jgi:hypothetical protein
MSTIAILCSAIFFPLSVPATPAESINFLSSWNDLPASIAKSAQVHLRQRLGTNYYARVRLDYAYFAPPGLILRVALSLPNPALRVVHGNLILEPDGSVLQEIDLPDLALYPGHGVRISAKRAMTIARSHGLIVEGKEDIQPSLVYSRESDTWLWKFTSPSLVNQSEDIAFFSKGNIYAVDSSSGNFLGSQAYSSGY